MTWSGRLLHIHIAPSASSPMEELAQARLIAGRGIEAIAISKASATHAQTRCARGDADRNRNTGGNGAWRACLSRGRRSVGTRGPPAISPRPACRSSHLVGKRFKVGEVVLDRRVA